jgi:hypothetical protein
MISLLVGSAYGAQRAFSTGWERVTRFSPAAWQAAKPAAGPAPLANRLVLIVVDGLRPDETSLLPSLDRLRRLGSAYSLSAPGPSYQLPVSATLLTGAQPQTHGVVLPTVTQPLQADSLFTAAARVRIPAGGVGQPGLGQLLGPTAGTWHNAGDAAALLAQARTLLAPTGPRLVLVQTNQLVTGRQGAKSADPASPSYKEVLGQLDAQLMQMFELVDLKTVAVVVVGSTPTDAAGVHRAGAPVPLIMAGAGIREGARGDASLTDVAPTVAALLGSPTPLESQGRPLLDALQVEGRPADVITQRYLDSRKASTDAALQALGARQAAPEPPATAAEAADYEHQLTQTLNNARTANWKRTLPQQLPYLGGAVLLALLYLIVAYRQPYGGALLAGSITYAAAFHALFFLTGGAYATGMAGLESPGRMLALTLGLKAAVAMAVAAAITGFLLSRKGFKKRSYLTAAGMHMALSTAVLLSLPVVVMLAFVGWDFPVALPPFGLLIWFFLTALQVMLIGYLSPLWGVVTVSATRLAHRLWPVKEIGDPVRNADNVVRLKALRRHTRR